MMKAIVLEEKGQPVVHRDFESPVPAKGETLVALKAAALNHRDVWITKGMYPGIRTPGILGSDGAGLADSREVIINPNIGWGDKIAHQKPDYTILGMPAFGTMAEQISVPADRLADKPAHLNWAEAAALPLGGLTAYRAVFTKGQCQPGDKVLISGIGGGVALFAFQFALAAGAEVYVTSGSPEKLSHALQMGAKGGANYKEEDWDKTLGKASGGFDLIVDSAGGAGFARFPKICNFGARIVTYGGTQGKVPNFSPQLIFWKQIAILGTSMGSDQEFHDMVGFVNQHKVYPVVDQIFPLAEAPQAFERMDQGKQFGKIVLSI
ncbi:MAG: zinc-binding dehydrogenase [Phaeodactylibacter sp.]|uniref:quinone oxidoreductase family protein n=1 Tax=Phaeodactylibacter sp. TaxID=1940289 RepID=UPI0032F00F28